jgi:translation initiation factor 1
VSAFHRPFAGLGERFGLGPAQPASDEPAPVASDPLPGDGPSTTGRAIPRAVVRIERTGRGGKEVTVVERLGLPPIERERWLKALKATLGCGGVVEGDALVLQGDHRKRLPAILSARGVKQVTVVR